MKEDNLIDITFCGRKIKKTLEITRCIQNLSSCKNKPEQKLKVPEALSFQFPS